jgi:hypothetical protein
VDQEKGFVPQGIVDQLMENQHPQGISPSLAAKAYAHHQVAGEQKTAAQGRKLLETQAARLLESGDAVSRDACTHQGAGVHQEGREREAVGFGVLSVPRSERPAGRDLPHPPENHGKDQAET